MNFDIVSRIYYMKMSITNNKEYFTRDSFSTVNATYNKSDDTYTILKERNEFKTKKEYIKYLSNYSNNICKLYKVDFIDEKNKLGTTLLRFLNYDFTNFNSFVEFVYNFGLPALVFNNGDKNTINPFNKYTHLNITNDKENIFLTETDFILVCKNNYKKRKKILIDYQSQFKAIINFVNNLSNLEYLEDFSIIERFYIYKQSDFTNYSDMSITLNSCITLVYDVSPIKYVGVDLHVDTDNFEENAKIMSEYIKNYYTEYEDEIFPFINFNCHTVETACLICMLELIKNNTPIYICKNCGNYFIPSSKKNTLYCNNCQEIGAMITYNEKLKKDKINLLYRKTLSAKKMLANRNPDIPMYLEKYEQWKKEANEFKKDIKQGLKAEEEFKKWIEETRKK